MQTSSYTQKPLHVNHVETLLWQETYDDSKYFDLRRWKDAKDEESLPMYGCNVFTTAQL